MKYHVQFPIPNQTGLRFKKINKLNKVQDFKILDITFMNLEALVFKLRRLTKKSKIIDYHDGDL